MQYGALPYRFTKSGAREILLVTTRQTKRWIIPKGWPIKGLKPAKSAAREAYEEAGVRGSVKTKAIGIFSYKKRSDDDGITIPCDVRVFPLLVKRKSQTWPESDRQLRSIPTLTSSREGCQYGHDEMALDRPLRQTASYKIDKLVRSEPQRGRHGKPGRRTRDRSTVF